MERWLDEGHGAGVDLRQMGSHATTCAACYQRLSAFFRTVELPESSYLKETIDELAYSLLNLARAIIRDLPPDTEEPETAIITITRDGGGSAEDNVESGHEMIDDAEDYTGTAQVGDLDLARLRGLLADAKGGELLRGELALDLFMCVTRMESRYEAEAWNWIGALHYGRERLDEAEAAFLKVLSLSEGITEVRSFAHCTLAYIFKHRGDLDRAVRAARSSVVLAEEDGKDPYFGQFAELYVRLLRDAEGDEGACRDLLRGLKGSNWDRFCEDIKAPANAPVLEAYSGAPVSEEFPL